MCIDPYYKNNLSILGSVKNSVIKSSNSKYHNFEKSIKISILSIYITYQI